MSILGLIAMLIVIILAGVFSFIGMIGVGKFTIAIIASIILVKVFQNKNSQKTYIITLLLYIVILIKLGTMP